MTRPSERCLVASEAEMLALGARLAPRLLEHGVVAVYLMGDLGAGKTTLCRGILQGLGYRGRVRSPTYTLMETYQLSDTCVCHFDLYRMNHPEELEFIGCRDYFVQGNICLVEWPEKGEGWLPPPDLEIGIAQVSQQRQVRLEWHR